MVVLLIELRFRVIIGVGVFLLRDVIFWEVFLDIFKWYEFEGLKVVVERILLGVLLLDRFLYNGLVFIDGGDWFKFCELIEILEEIVSVGVICRGNVWN